MDGDEQFNPYVILGIRRDCSKEEIKRSYHRLIKELHPDKIMLTSSDEISQSEARFQQVHTAYNLLKNSHERSRVDAELMKSEIQQPMPISENLDLSDMEYKEELKEYSYTCRCGGIYLVSKDDLLVVDALLISCSSCSLSIQVFKCTQRS